MRILIAASEAVPFAKTGGLADVAGALFKEYRRMAQEAYLMLPLYREIRQGFDLADTGMEINIPVGDKWFRGRIFSYESSIFFLECDEFFDRPELYRTSVGDYPDNASRFIFFSRAILEACATMDIKPDIVHCNDWHTGLVPVYLKTLYRDAFIGTATLLTIHNLGYQGLFDADDFNLTGLSLEWFSPGGLEFYGKVNFLKGGIVASDIITTVSNAYAKEILTAEYGCGLDGVLRKRSEHLYGVLNGLDTEEWNPMSDRYIAACYSPADISGKQVCKEDLLKECGLNSGDRGYPLLAFVGRLSEQKGIDIFLEAADDIIKMNAKLVILGKGDERFHSKILGLAKRHTGKVYARIGYDEDFAHRIYAGSDIFLMPSRYEPCGIGQLIAMKYGAVPVARKTGGLEDTITGYNPSNSGGTGFLFDGYSSDSLRNCLSLALSVYKRKGKWKDIVAGAMAKDFTWKNSAKRYIALYKKAMKKADIKK